MVLTSDPLLAAGSGFPKGGTAMNTMAPTRYFNSHLTFDVIDTYAGFIAAESAWKALQARDPEMTFFLSWDWLAQAFRNNPYRWSVIAIRDPKDNDRLLGLLPLKYRVHWSRSRQEFQSEIEAGGRLLFSEYTGFICDPEAETAVLETMAQALRGMPWARMSLRYVAQQRRAEIFCGAFERFGYPVSWQDYRINNGETDNLICPQVSLTGDFEHYLQTSISANTRQRHRRVQRRHFAKGAYHFTLSDADSFERDLATLMRFWIHKWTPSKGADTARDVASNFETMLRAALAADALFLPILWRGDQPLAALGHVIDRGNGVMHFIIAGRDTTANEAFIGNALHFHSIEQAIALGCDSYDFGHGDEAYKFSYGAEKTKLQYFSIRRPELRRDNIFDSLGTGAALRRIEGFISSGKTEQAARGCRQLSRLFR
jgi:CelD/BcsL family acetyltransferase involved in cellulose biosynthesis